jgi:hypothetical protein
MEIFRDSTGQPSDLLEKAAAPASPNTEHSSETHRGKMMGIRPANSNEKGMTTAELNASSQRPIIRWMKAPEILEDHPQAGGSPGALNDHLQLQYHLPFGPRQRTHHTFWTPAVQFRREPGKFCLALDFKHMKKISYLKLLLLWNSHYTDLSP